MMSEIPRVLKHRIDDGVGSWCILEYYAWLTMGGPLARASTAGIPGISGDRRERQIAMELVHILPISTHLYQQVIPSSLDHLIQPVDHNNNMEEDPIEPTETIEEDPKEYLEIYDPRDGGIMIPPM
ncbi:hypothetical protein HAX54_040599 [Datura stramonium]|uniref:Uncharacterized protein n=1 Tax=Datura stramonium TaxID=4076 RepID=A0ABS8VSW6_DATST|nr:hypothetical protein [Datura stramonium]